MSDNCEPTSGRIEIELLAPARNAETAIAAIDHGADAVYMGAPSHGARRQAANSLDDISKVVEYAHRFNVRVYVTVNTIVYDDELADVERLVWDLYAIGVDALIVQDMALLSLRLPPIALHASTQCDIRTPRKARFLQDAGFSQLVLPRELTIDEIKEFRAATDVPLEAFVHGALCVSYSGDCQASFLTTGRSANRGECAQICRYAFSLVDDRGNVIIHNKHLLSLKDMNRIDSLSDMLEAGVSSFKIEGRLKDTAYVKNVVAAYSRALNHIVEASGGRYVRVSQGVVDYSFTPDLAKSFNRGFTSYFLKSPRSRTGELASVDSPKWVGEKVGTVERVMSPRTVRASLDVALENGDGLGFFNADGVFCGFRLNRVDNGTLYSASDITPSKGTVLYRNFDKRWNDLLGQRSAVRTIPVDMMLRAGKGFLELSVSDSRGHLATAVVAIDCEPARSGQYEARLRALSKLGDTEFRLNRLDDNAGNLFIPASVLTSLRRDAVDAFRHVLQSTYTFQRRREKASGLQLPDENELTRHDNIANNLSAKFYAGLTGRDAASLPRAVEVAAPSEGEVRVMQTRYCLRRELGACLRTKEAASLPSKLYLVSGNSRFRLGFDCSNCRMEVFKRL